MRQIKQYFKRLLKQRPLLLTIGASLLLLLIIGGILFINQPRQSNSNYATTPPTTPHQAIPASTPNIAKNESCQKQNYDNILDNKLLLWKMSSIISSFENSTTAIQYSYIENINDKHGFTAGRAGFTSGTGDMLKVIENYSKAKPNNALSKYIKPLREIYKQYSEHYWDIEKMDIPSSGLTTGLDGITQAWQEASKDNYFIAAQDSVYEELYLKPSLKLATDKKINYPLGILAILDTQIQLGTDNVQDIANRTPASLKQKEWIRTFLLTRREQMSNSPIWKDTTARVDTLMRFSDDQNYDLKGDLSWEVYGDTFHLKEQDSKLCS